jgi:hypothetical protein
MHDGIVGLVLRTFQSVFPHVEIWDCGGGDIILLGSLRPWESSVAHYQPAFERPQLREDLRQLGIGSPAALLARQLASQQTAFAIPGDGPIQADAFPLLEYEAPRAFYIGQNSTLLQEFDERTWQMENCPEEKRRVLQALRRSDLERQFTQLASINLELHQAMHRQFQGATSLGNFPCIFSLSGNIQPDRDIPEDVDDEIRSLLTASAWIRTDRKREGADAIAALLENRGPDSDWAPAHYAAQAVKASLAIPDPGRARRILNLGLKLVPDDGQLHYLARIVERKESDAASNP